MRPDKPQINVEVRDVVCDYGIYINGELVKELIFNGKCNAELVADVLRKDYQHETHEKAWYPAPTEEIVEGDYISGYECIGPNRIVRPMNGWVEQVLKTQAGLLIGYDIRCDDGYKGHRQNMVCLSYGPIKKLPPKEQP